jgi:hypothetical protein
MVILNQSLNNSQIKHETHLSLTLPTVVSMPNETLRTCLERRFLAGIS